MGLVPAFIFGDGTFAVYSYHLNSYKEMVGSGKKNTYFGHLNPARLQFFDVGPP
jgi:hypothetical protein